MANPEKFPTMDHLDFATPEDAKKAEAMFNDMIDRIRSLTGLVLRLQWGSCDGCGQHDYCPLCKQARSDIWGEHGKHTNDCPIAAVLRSS